MRTIPPRRLLFSGGGVRVISYLGALQVFQENNLLKHVREFCGVSAGALVALMLALGYSFRVIERFCYEFDFNSMHTFDLESIYFLKGTDSKEDSIQEVLNDLLQDGFILPIKNTSLSSLDSLNNYIYKFSHDRIHQASYQLLSEEERQNYHYKWFCFCKQRRIT
jgi:predicted acylesterase/phospholipase RssA